MSTRIDRLKSWLGKDAGLTQFRIEPASVDASFRQYFRIFTDGQTFIVMDAPPEKESCTNFIDVTERLHAAGINAPQIHKQDLQQGFILMSDLGNQQLLQLINDTNADDFYRDAIDTLHDMQHRCETRGLPPYDETQLRKEMMLFNDWLLNEHIGYKLKPDESEEIYKLHDLLVMSALEQPQVFVHRDYHSRNLMFNHKNNPGVLDYQDAMTGPVTYDVVSLLKDCYVKWPEERIQRWLKMYYENSREFPATVDAGTVKRWFDLMGVQRHLKASGIFCRLFHRDGKSGYLKDIPRTLSYIVDMRSDYPEVRSLCELIDTVVLPRLAQVGA